VHEEVTKWHPWVAAIVWSGALAGAILSFRALSDPVQGGGLYAAVMGCSILVVVPIAIQVLFGRFRVRVTRTSLRLSFGYTPFIKRIVEFEDVEAMASIRYSPLREFGGWGIRSSIRGGKRAWTIRGNRALVLTLSSGIRMYVGSPDPDRLAERIRVVADIPSAVRENE